LGVWDAIRRCPDNTFAVGFQLIVHRSCGAFCDDTSLNQIKLICQGGSVIQSPQMGPILAIPEASKIFMCNSNTYITGFRADLELYQGLSDDTGMNNIEARCSDGKILTGNGDSLGDWGNYVECPYGFGVAGIQTQFDNIFNAAVYDQTGITNVRLKCESYKTSNFLFYVFNEAIFIDAFHF
jgi:hypothetical protein